jgi:hypothetical protein
MRKLALLSVFLALPLATGCKTVVAPTPATAPSIYQQGSQAMDDFATDLVSAQNIEQGLYKGGAIPAATHATLESTFNQIAGYGIQVDALIKTQASATTIAARINSALSLLATVSTTAAGLDSATSVQVTGCVQALQALLTQLLPIFTTK